MGQRRRDICLGFPPVKLLWNSNSNLPEFSRQTATVEPKDRVISSLTEAVRITRDDVVEAADRIAGKVERTSLIETEIGGVRTWLKCECLQTGGSFKLRGATNRLLQLSSRQRERGVVAFSSGNHARGVAIAAKRLGIRAIIVMPADAPRVKVDGTRSEGAEIIFYNRLTESREEIAARIAAETGATVVPSFDDPAIVAGQGTAGLEIVEQLGRAPERIVIPCGGGGLASGIALAVPEAEIVIVEPHGWDDMGRSLEKGEIIPVGPDAPATYCDAIQTLRVAALTFGVLQRREARALSVTDAEVADAIRFAWDKHQLVVEPGAAVGLAALLADKIELAEDTVVLLSGANIDPALHARIIGEA
jgi:threonine dehydratase